MSMARDSFVIARREFLERVKSVWFVAMTLLGPFFMVAMIVVPALIAGRGASGSKVAIVDHSGVVGAALATELTALDWKPELIAPESKDATDEALRARIRSKSLNGYIVVPADALDSGETVYRGDNASSQSVGPQLHQRVAKVVIGARGLRAHVDPATLRALTDDVKFSSQHTTGETPGSSGLGAFFIAYVLAIILYMVITLYGVAVMRSVVVEKTSRVMELMVAAVKPSSLMAGKILGVGAAGLVQVATWLAMGAMTLAYRDTILGAFGARGGGPTLPPLAAAQIACVLAFFVLGFFFYAALYAAVGAMVSSEAETQQVQLPITMVLVVGVTCLQLISNDPRGTASQLLTLVPAWSPILMPMRYVLGGATGTEVLISLAILLASTVLVIRVAAKIYRVGVLMYGKRPSLAELWRWVRH